MVPILLLTITSQKEGEGTDSGVTTPSADNKGIGPGYQS